MEHNASSFVEACLAGDSASWSRVREISLKFLRKRGHACSDAQDDIAQNVIIKLLKGFRDFTGTTEGELHAYINVTTLREAVSFYRQNARHQSHDSLDQPLDPNDPDQTFKDLLPDSRLTPEAVAEINEILRQASARLSVRDMQLVLYKAEGYKDREIAEMLGFATVGGVAVTYNRIRELLRKALLAITLIILFGRKLPWIVSQ